MDDAIVVVVVVAAAAKGSCCGVVVALIGEFPDDRDDCRVVAVVDVDARALRCWRLYLDRSSLVQRLLVAGKEPRLVVVLVEAIPVVAGGGEVVDGAADVLVDAIAVSIDSSANGKLCLSMPVGVVCCCC